MLCEALTSRHPLARLPHEMKTADANSGNTPKLTEQQYFDERKLLLEARQRGYQRAEQIITGGSTGALVLSSTFLRNFGSEAGLLASEWLVSAWVLLLIALFLSLLLNYTSAKSFNVEILRMDARQHDEKLPANPAATFTRWCGPFTALLFVVGIAALAFFAYENAPFQLQP